MFRIRALLQSCVLNCEPRLCSATNIQTSIRIEGNEIVVNGHKWCVATTFCFLQLKSDARHT